MAASNYEPCAICSGKTVYTADTWGDQPDPFDEAESVAVHWECVLQEDGERLAKGLKAEAARCKLRVASEAQK